MGYTNVVSLDGGWKAIKKPACPSKVYKLSRMNSDEAAWGLFASNRDPRLPVRPQHSPPNFPQSH